MQSVYSLVGDEADVSKEWKKTLHNNSFVGYVSKQYILTNNKTFLQTFLSMPHIPLVESCLPKSTKDQIKVNKISNGSLLMIARLK